MKKSEELKQLTQDLHDARMNLQAAEERLTDAEEAFHRFAVSLDETAPEPTQQETKKRGGGRKPGSKNKPKPAAQPQTQFNPATFSEDETLISLFDRHNWTTEERAHFISKQQDKSEPAMILAFKEIVE